MDRRQALQNIRDFDHGDLFTCARQDGCGLAVTMLGASDPEAGTPLCKAHFLALLEERRTIADRAAAAERDCAA